MKINQVEFSKSYPKFAQLPESRFPEIAFVGRSNVGKSSLLNHLCNKKIAHTSQTPGKTQLLNYFLINRQFYFVDLPGYGYAKVARQKKQIWSREIEKYLQFRKQLKIIVFLLDIRRIPNEQDRMINQWLINLPDISPLYILTKADKLSRSRANQQKTMIAKELFVDQMDFIFYSTLKNWGKQEIIKEIDMILSELKKKDLL